MRFCLLFSLIFIINDLNAQNKQFTLSIIPGLGTSGLNPKNISNTIEVNLLSGYAYSFHGVSISTLSSFYKFNSAGLQVSGVLNLIGGNRLDLKEYSELELKNSSSDFKGFQLFGFLNLVTGSSSGIQIAGDGNISLRGDAHGMQLSGFVNYDKGHYDGFQLAGFSNVIGSFFTGVQWAVFFNTIPITT